MLRAGSHEQHLPGFHSGARWLPCRGLARPAWDQRALCLAFFSRLGSRDLFFLASFGTFVDFMLGTIWGADSPAVSGSTALFPAPLSAAFVALAEPPSIVPFFLSAISSSSRAEFPEILSPRLVERATRLGQHQQCGGGFLVGESGFVVEARAGVNHLAKHPITCSWAPGATARGAPASYCIEPLRL